jgi:GNAT superfamily N-acetyltransferase
MLAIRIAAMRPSLEALGRFDPHRARERLWSRFDPEHMQHIVVEGRRVGFVTVREAASDEVGAGPDRKLSVIEHFYLVPEAQGAGLGAAVLDDIKSRASANGRGLSLEALRQSRANAFYRRHGFQAVSETEFDTRYEWWPT